MGSSVASRQNSFLKKVSIFSTNHKTTYLISVDESEIFIARVWVDLSSVAFIWTVHLLVIMQIFFRLFENSGEKSKVSSKLTSAGNFCREFWKNLCCILIHRWNLSSNIQHVQPS